MKKTLLLTITFLIVLSMPSFATDPQVRNTVVGNGIGIGSALAVSICWSRTESVLTSAIAGLFSWIYVIYYLLVRDK